MDGEEGPFSLALHPRLTVIAGLGEAERERLCGELIGALGVGRPGVHAEVVDDHGRHLGVFRPEGARHRVVDLDEGVDVSDRYRGATGDLDLLAVEGIDAPRAQQALRLARGDLARASTGEDPVCRLAEVGQSDLWAAAAAVQVAVQVAAEGSAASSGPAGSAGPEVTNAAEDRPERRSRYGWFGSRRSRAEATGGDDGARAAERRWAGVAGEVSVDWALAHREVITAAARLCQDLHSLDTMSATAPAVDTKATSDLVSTLVGRMVLSRALGASRESFPLLLDDPFVGLGATVKPPLLELLGRTAGNPQAVLLTGDEDVASWARLEVLTGELSLLEPTLPLPVSAGARV